MCANQTLSLIIKCQGRAWQWWNCCFYQWGHSIDLTPICHGYGFMQILTVSFNWAGVQSEREILIELFKGEFSYFMDL